MSTPRQLKAAIKTAENIRNPKPKSIGVVLIESGYSIPVSKRPSTVTHSKGYIDALAPLLKTHNITVNRYLGILDNAMNATKVITSHTEPDYEVADHSIRLSAAKQAKELINNQLTSDSNPAKDNKALTDAINSNVDEVELQRVVFKTKGT